MVAKSYFRTIETSERFAVYLYVWPGWTMIFIWVGLPNSRFGIGITEIVCSPAESGSS